MVMNFPKLELNLPFYLILINSRINYLVDHGIDINI